MQHNHYLEFVLVVFYHLMCDQCGSLHIITRSTSIQNATKTYDKQCYIMMDSEWDTVALDIFQKIYFLFKFYAAVMTKLSVTELT